MHQSVPIISISLKM